MRVRLGRWVLYQAKIPPAVKPVTPPPSPAPSVSTGVPKDSRKAEAFKPEPSKPKSSTPAPSKIEPVIPLERSTSASEPQLAKPPPTEPP